ncbi:DOPA-like domain-containing protein [Plectosphaerella plurivora]|uniref:DOPA-like domain-containing protein n=1 Tax=Plectosphaerella plurivora TaxID=936078 RepID=A0A9P8V6Z9_9PEZI|nr:DOPA-like domain-containing protein [Plectosphaerella plurivora]
MSDAAAYSYKSPLEGVDQTAPLTEDRREDGKSLVNPPRDGLSEAYNQFTDPLDRGVRGGFDVHIYYYQNNPAQAKYARELWERIRREFPELRIYRFWDRPIGPHPIAMFEVNIFTPAQFGAFIPWLVIYRGPLSALVHPNTVEEGVSEEESELRNHTQRATWLGDKVPLDTSMFYRKG